MEAFLPGPFVTTLVLAAALVLAFVVAPMKRFDAAFITLTILAILYIGRGLLISTGLDGAHPTDAFTDPSPFLMQAQICAGVWVLFLAVAIRYCGFLAKPFSNLLPPPPPMSAARLLFVCAFLLTAAAVCITLYLAAASGGVLHVMRSIRAEVNFRGMYALRQFAALGMFAAVGCFLAFSKIKQREGGASWPAFVSLLLFVFNAAQVFLWGGREDLVAASLTLIFGYSMTVKTISTTKIATLALVLLGVVLGLRYTRDIMLHGKPYLTQQGNEFRQASVSFHLVRVDSFMLTLNYWDVLQCPRDGEDFFWGAAQAVPRLLWPEKPETTKFGQWLKKETYYSSGNDGWPTDAVGIWYINFLWPGVVFGALLSGLIVRMVQERYGNFDNPMAYCYGSIMAFEVFQTGFTPESFTRFVLWCIPLYALSIVVAILRAVYRRRTSVYSR